MPFDQALVDDLAGRLYRAEQMREQIPQFSRAYDC